MKPETNMSTPRTDAAWREWEDGETGGDGTHEEVAYHMRHFARSLETELAAALEREKVLKEALERLHKAADEELSIVYYSQNNSPAVSGTFGAMRAIAKQALALCTEGNPNTPAAYP